MRSGLIGPPAAVQKKLKSRRLPGMRSCGVLETHCQPWGWDRVVGSLQKGKDGDLKMQEWVVSDEDRGGRPETEMLR